MHATIGLFSAVLATVIASFEVIPKEIWAAVVAAGVASFVAISTNKNARLIIEAQLRDATRLEESKRQMQLRRDVYLPAAKAFTFLVSTIADLMNVAVPDVAIREAYKNAVADIVGVQVIAGSNTLSAVSKLTRAAAELYLDLTVMRARMMGAKVHLDAISQIETLETQTGTGLVELMRHHNLSGGASEQWVRIQIQWDIHQRALAKFVSQRQENQKALLRLNFEMMDVFKAKMSSVMTLQAAAAIELRRELNLPTDEVEFLRLAKEAREAAQAALERATTALQNMVSEPIAPAGQA